MPEINDLSANFDQYSELGIEDTWNRQLFLTLNGCTLFFWKFLIFLLNVLNAVVNFRNDFFFTL